MIKFKDKSIGLQSLSSQLLLAIIVIEGQFIAHGEILWVTSVNDGKHSSGSSHYRGMGMDVRSQHFKADKHQILKDCLDALAHNPDFYMVLEYEGTVNEHFHLQYKPKRRSYHS